MVKVVVCLTCLALGQAAGAPVKTIEDGVLDKMVLYVETLDNPTSVPIVMRPFDASMADLGTGNKGGKETRQEEARTMQGEGPRVLAERFATALRNSGPFKSVRVLKVDEGAPEAAILVEGKFVTLDPGSRTKRYFAGFGAGKSSVKVVGIRQGLDGTNPGDLRAATYRRHGHRRR